MYINKPMKFLEHIIIITIKHAPSHTNNLVP
jgi:hypothetical protein